MDENEARTYEDQDDERIHKFRETAAKRLPLMQETLKAATLSLDPDGVLHLALPASDTIGGSLLNNRERREALEAVARESGLPGPVAVETRASPEPDRSPSRASSTRSDPTVPDRRDPAVDNVLRVLGGRLIRVIAPPAPEPAEGGPHGEPE
jgi:hypothetical protein